jgi:hypothetical protein
MAENRRPFFAFQAAQGKQKSVFRCQVSGVRGQSSRWLEKRPVKSIKKLCSFASAVFGLWERFLTAIYPGNRGRRPLPPAINFYLNDLEFYIVSYEQRL